MGTSLDLIQLHELLNKARREIYGPFAFGMQPINASKALPDYSDKVQTNTVQYGIFR